MVDGILSQITSQTDMPEGAKSGEQRPKNLSTQQESPLVTTARSFCGKACSPQVIHVPDDSPAKTDRRYKSPACTRSSGPAIKVFPAVAEVMSLVDEAPISSPIQRTVGKQSSEINIVHERHSATLTNSAAHVQPRSKSLQGAAQRDHSSPTVAHPATSNANEQPPEGKSDSGHRQEPVESPEQAHSPEQAVSPPVRSSTHTTSQVHSSLQESVSKATVVQSTPAIQSVSAPLPDPVSTKLSESNMQKSPKGQVPGDKPVKMMYSVRLMLAVKSTNPLAQQEDMGMAQCFEETQNMEVEARHLQFEDGKREDKNSQVLRDLVRRRAVGKQRTSAKKRCFETDEDRQKWIARKRYECEERHVSTLIKSRKERMKSQEQERKDRLAQENGSYDLRALELGCTRRRRRR